VNKSESKKVLIPQTTDPRGILASPNLLKEIRFRAIARRVKLLSAILLICRFGMENGFIWQVSETMTVDL
jgi:hypothetical protein